MRDTISARVAKLTREASIEISPGESHELVKAKPYLAPGSLVTITWLPKDTYEARVAAAKATRDAGFEPVPHIAARRVNSEADLRGFLKRLKEEAGVQSVFVVGGDVKKLVGPYASAFDLIRGGAIEEAGMKSVAVTGYPEPHPGIPEPAIEQAYHDKLGYLQSHAIEPYVLTQFSFDAEAIANFLRKRRVDGDKTLIRLGVAGPANLGQLLRFAARCGVATSAKTFFTHTDSMMKLLVETSPMPILRALAEMPDYEEVQPFGLHFFAFGGFVRTCSWISEIANAGAEASARA